MAENSQWGRIKEQIFGFLFKADAPGRGRRVTKGEFDTALESALDARKSVLVGHMKILNLREIIVLNYTNPEPVLKRAEETALSVFDEILSEGESYISLGSGSYGLLFPNLSKEAGDLKCAVIADQIARLLREQAPCFADLKIERLTRTFDERARGPRRKRSRRAEARTPVRDQKDIAAERELQEKKKWATHALEKMIPQAEDGDGAPQAEGAHPLGGLQQALANVRALPPGIHCLYRPMWHVKHRLLTAYSCLLAKRDADGTVELGKTTLMGDTGGAKDAADLDFLLLGKAVEALVHLFSDNRKAVLVIPVHFSTLDREPYRNQYFATLGSLSGEVCKYLVMEFLETPKDIFKARVVEAVDRVRRYSRAVLAQVELNVAGLEQWKGIGLHALGFDLLDQKLPERTVMQIMDRFVESAERTGVRSYVHGIPSISLTTAAIGAGFDYVDGETILSLFDLPEGVRSFEAEMIYSPLLEGKTPG